MESESRNPSMNMEPEAVGRWRLFCALEIPQQTRLRISERISTLRALVPDSRASWTREANIHLTLKFYGETLIERIPQADEAISRAVAGIESFAITIAGTGVFPRPRDPRILWIGINDLTGTLAKLQSRLEQESERKGFAKEERQFHPHLTLTRLRSQQGARELASAHLELEFPPDEIHVTEVLLIRSQLSSAGSKYTTLARYPLVV